MKLASWILFEIVLQIINLESLLRTLGIYIIPSVVTGSISVVFLN